MGKLDVMTSLLGFGCMRFPLNAEGEIDEEISGQMLLEAYRSGVNYFDTAYTYHNSKSESFTGRVLNRLPRESYYLATKFPSWLLRKTSDIREILNIQLNRLDKNFVDFYLLIR